MKRFYYIFPLVLLAAFILLYTRFSASSDALDAERAQKVAAVKMAEAKAKAETEEKSREDSQKRSAERLAEERAKEADKAAKWEAESKRLAEEAEKYATQSAALTREITTLEKQLADLHAVKDARTRELLNGELAVELASVNKHNAELEIQRMTEMLLRRVSKSSLVKQ